MNRRNPRVQTLPPIVGDVLTFEPFKTVDKVRGVSDESGNHRLQIFEVLYGKLNFGYLYLSADQYSLVWKSSEGFKFELPYTQVELQFSKFATSQIYRSKPCLPKRNHPMEFKGYENQKVTATLLFLGEDKIREFDLRHEGGKESYRSELLDQQSESLSRIAFARFDSEILYRGEFLKICFTAERMEANDEWELVVNLPRGIALNPRSLRWAVENHESEELMRRMDIEASHDALSRVLSR